MDGYVKFHPMLFPTNNNTTDTLKYWLEIHITNTYLFGEAIYAEIIHPNGL